VAVLKHTGLQVLFQNVYGLTTNINTGNDDADWTSELTSFDLNISSPVTYTVSNIPTFSQHTQTGND